MPETRPNNLFRPHERAQLSEPAPATRPQGKRRQTIQEVLASTHQPVQEGDKVRFQERTAAADRLKIDRVVLRAKRLSVAGKSYDVEDHASTITLLGPNEKVISAIDTALGSHRTVLLSAAPGSAAAFTARWALDAMNRRYAFARISRSSSLESLVGSLRPDEHKNLRVELGPLAICIRDGHTMVLSSVERADPQLRATLKALSSGLQVFHHPATGDPIKVHKNFKLVLIGDQRERRLASQLGVNNVREIPAYDEAEHRRILTEQLGLKPVVAAVLAQFHQALIESVANSDLDFGRHFPLGWELLERAGRRIAQLPEADDADIARVLFGIYGARLVQGSQRDRFLDLLSRCKLPPFGELAPTPSTDETFVHTDRLDRILSLAEEALDAGEVVHLRGPGQSGVTRLVDELALRRKQNLVTIIGHSGIDSQTLIEKPTFDENGDFYFKPGRISRALIDGDLLYFDHFDHLPREQQNAVLQLTRLKTIRVLENDKLVEKPVSAQARIIVSTTTGHFRGRTAPDPTDRAGATEIAVDPPSFEELTGPFLRRILPAPNSEALRKAIVDAARSVSDSGAVRLNRMQRFADFARTAELLAEHGFDDKKEAVERALDLVYGSKVADQINKSQWRRLNPPLWRRILQLTDREVAQVEEKTGYQVTNSMQRSLDCLAIAFALGRPVRAIGPASAGKTVLGAVFGGLIDKAVVRSNFSASTEGQRLLSGMGPVNEGGKTVFRESSGPARTAADTKALLLADEFNLSRQGQMALKSALDLRTRIIDPEGDHEACFRESFFYSTENPTGSTAGRFEPPPEIADCMFTLYVEPRPVEEKVEGALKRCPLRRELIAPIADFFTDLELLVEKGKIRSQIAPVTSTERDILKAARAAHYLIERDGLRDPDEQRKVVGRETYRVIRDQLLDRLECQKVLDLVRRYFGDDVEPPARPTGVERVGDFIQIGVARMPIRKLDPELQHLVPSEKGLKDPVGAQFEFLESVLLGMELNHEPVTVIGDTGTGKTMLFKWLARQLNQPVIEQPFNEEMLEEHIVGQQVVKNGNVEFRYGDLPACIKGGIWYVADEPTTLNNSVREGVLNCVTERSEIQISQKQPPERILAKDWHPEFRYTETANGDNIRQHGYSGPEASRRRIVALREIDNLGEYLEIAQRDYGADVLDADVHVGVDVAESDTADKDRPAVEKGRLTRANEVHAATEFFFQLRQLQQKSSDAGLTPLTPRIFGGFMDALVRFRERRSFPASLLRAAELFLGPNLPKKLKSKMTSLILEHVKQLGDAEPASLPELSGRAVRFGDVFIEIGSEHPWKPSNERFPLTESRCRNLQAIAEAMELGRGRAISVTDDENGEAVETLREFGRLTGKRVTEVSLPPNVELEQLLERLIVRPESGPGFRPKARKGSSPQASKLAADRFEPELQQIAQAVRAGHILVLRNCGQVSTNRLERLNSLGDGRQAIRLPISGEWLEAPGEFRLVMMRAPDSVQRFSAALENRLITPPLTTQERPTTEAEREARAAELAAVLRERCQISRDAADKLGVFHVYLNQLLREGRFASGRAVEAFLNFDAESVGKRLGWLLDRKEIAEEDQDQALITLVMDVYGERLLTPADRNRLLDLAQRAFVTSSSGIDKRSEVSPGPSLNRVGPWALTRDSRGKKENLPSPDSVLPDGEIFDEVLWKVAAAAQYDEVIHLAGNNFIANAAVASLARLTTSPISVVEGNREMPEAHLFGGSVQNPKTGEFEEMEGLVFKAQAEGGTLVIKNASRLPPEILTRLTQIAATGRLQRVKNGQLEEPLRAFRLVLCTSDTDPPLSRELASLARTIRCPEIVEAEDLRTVALHHLRRLPGTKLLAEQIVDFHLLAREKLDEESQFGRQEIRIDSNRLVEATQDIARMVLEEGIPLERAVSEVLTRLYVRPLEGLAAEQALVAQFDTLIKALDGWLQVEKLPAIDLVESPEVDGLRQDYSKVAVNLSSELVSAAADALNQAIADQNLAHARKVLRLLDGCGLVRTEIALRARSLDSVSSDEELLAKLPAFSRIVAKEASTEGGFSDAALSFVRGARVWDLDYRLEIIADYDTHFRTLRDAGSAVAERCLNELESIRDRFDAAQARERLEQAGQAVEAATVKYQARAGVEDPEIEGLFKRLLATWDLVSTSPIFRAYALPELHELERSLTALEQAYEARGLHTPELVELSDAVRQASSTLEGIRIAEQSAELRRGILASNQGTDGLVLSLREEINTLRTLQAAETRKKALDEAEKAIRGAVEGDGFLRIDSGAEGVDRPAPKSDQEIETEAKERAGREVAKVVAEAMDALMEEVQGIAEGEQVPPVEEFFNHYDLELNPEPNRQPPSAAEVHYQSGVQQIAKRAETELKTRTDALVKELRAADEERVQRLFEARLKQCAERFVARTQTSVDELKTTLEKVAYVIGVDDELGAEVKQALVLLTEARRETGNWLQHSIAMSAQAAVNVSRMVGRFFLNSFGLDLPPEQAKPTPDLSAAKNAATRVLNALLEKLLAERAALPAGSRATHAANVESFVHQLTSAQSLGELAAKFAKLRVLHREEADPVVKQQMGAVLKAMSAERGMEETLSQVSAFCDGADALAAQAAKGGVSIDLASAVDAVMAAAEAVRTQELGPGAYKRTIQVLARAIEKIDELASSGRLPVALSAVREEMDLLNQSIGKMFSGRQELLQVDAGSYRAMLKSLSDGSGDPKESHVIEAVASSVAFTELEGKQDAEANALVSCIEDLSKRRRVEEESWRPDRATQLTVVNVSFDRAEKIQIDESKDKSGSSTKAAKTPEELEADRAQREVIRAITQRLEQQVALRSGQLDRERDRLCDVLQTVEDGRCRRAVSQIGDMLEHAGEQLQKLATTEESVRGFSRELKNALDQLRAVERRLSVLALAPEAATAKVRTAIEDARALEKAYNSNQFYELARGWAARAVLATVDARAILTSQLEKGEMPPSRELVPMTLRQVVEALAQPIGRLGAWSRLLMLNHAKQRLESVFDAEDAHHFAPILETIEEGIRLQANAAEGPEREQAAADVLEATVELGAALAEKARNVAPETEQTFGQLVDRVAEILEPGSERTEQDRAAITHAISLAEALAKSKEAGTRPARDLSIALGHLRSGDNSRTIREIRKELRDRATDYLENMREQRLLLDEAVRAFVDYDPLTTKQALGDVVRNLRTVIAEVSGALQGPAATTFLEIVQDLATRLQAGEGPAQEGRQILEEIDPLIRRAEVVLNTRALARFRAMLQSFENRTNETKSPSDELASWTEGAKNALVELMEAEDDRVPELLEAAQTEFFKDLETRGGEAGSRSGGKESAVEDGPSRPIAVSKLTNMLHGDLSSARAAAAQLAEGGPATPPAGDRTTGEAGPALPSERAAPKADDSLGNIQRPDLGDAAVTHRSDKVEIVGLSEEGLKSIRKRMQRSAEAEEIKEESTSPPLTQFESFVAQNQALVDRMAAVLRQFPGLETAIVIDQSGSTRNGSGGSLIIDQERAAMALIVAAHMRAERNCSVVGFGDKKISDQRPVSVVGGVSTFVHKPMALRLDRDSAEYTYTWSGVASGDTDLIEPIKAATGQFTAKANNKLVLVLTDAYLNDAANVRRYIDNLRAQGVGVAVMGFGAAQHVQLVAGEYGQHAKSYSEAINSSSELFMRTVVDNAGRFRGTVESSADGIGIPVGQAPLEAAPSDGPMDQALVLSEPVNIHGDPAETFAAAGPRRELTNLVDRARYEHAVKLLDQRHAQVARSESYKRLLREVRATRARHEREGTIEALAGAIMPSLPKTGGIEWERKQLSGSSFDEQQLIMYVAGRAQGVPVQRIFKRRKRSEETKATVVLAIDESTSMGDTEKMRANMEALFATGDALKAADPETKIAVVGYGDKVRLHAGFEHEWNDELKAHILHQLKGGYDATDDERAAAESIGLLRMMDADVGLVCNFSDGQGMPGMEAVMQSAKDDGYAFLTMGVGPDCVGVSRFGPYGLYARNLAQMVQRLGPGLYKAWEVAGRLA